MTAANQHIVTCFEQLGMTPEQIAETEQLELVAVKSILYQCSGAYREQIKQNRSLDFSDEQLDEANVAIANIMRYSEDEHLKLRAALYLRDDKKGRKDRVNGLKQLNINITQINQHLLQVAQQMQTSRSKALPGNNGSTDRSVLGNIKESETVDV